MSSDWNEVVGGRRVPIIWVSIIESIAWGTGFGILSLFFAGVRRLSWRYAGLVGLGSGLVFGALRLAIVDLGVDHGLPVLIAAVGASLATIGAERGERARVRRSAAILAGRPSALD